MSKSKELNEHLRNIISEELAEGSKKNHVCALTLGSQCIPQFDSFLRGRDFGFKPLERMFSAFDMELQLVPVPKDDTDTIKMFDKVRAENLNDMKQVLNKALSNSELRNSPGRSSSPMFKEVCGEILADIGIAPEKES